MKKFLAILLVVILASTVVLAAPMMKVKSFGPGYGPVKPWFGWQAREELRFQEKEQLKERARETLKEMYKKAFETGKLTKEQAQQILNIINEAKEKLNALQKEFEELRQKASKMTLNEYRNAVRELNQKRAEITKEAAQKIGDIVTVEQLELLRSQLRFTFKKCYVPTLNFFDEVILKALEEYAK
ncbi:hypothetical protein [Pseudothermotoga thermarum]|uniref:Outer membrane chaperone Skp (OmpH) n=1 Tax=Pseudothermotoga thermarum DSM 5069 TaxID=688269 RepID=F7YTY3_9THEM|nr:hypothetical protein [Pseudothermotoga thermarum]AEH51565.1 hypothetical protein Theth_1512 [Pseudothermotoga thermarum DSM 5069]